MPSRLESSRGVIGLIMGTVLLTASCGTPATTPLNSPAGTSTTIIIVRHAERDPGEFVPLNAEGFRRREALKEVLAENGVTAIYCTDTLRNRQTVEPLAELLGLEINLVNPIGFVNAAQVTDGLVQEILAGHFGGTVLFCGNLSGTSETNINEQVYRRLGGTGRAPVRYQDLYVAVVPEQGATRFVKTEYGGPSSLD